MQRSLRATVIATLLAAALVLPQAGSATAEPGGKPPKPPKPPRSAGPLDTDVDVAAGSFFDARIKDHIHSGQIHEQFYDAPAGPQDYLGEFTSPGTVVRIQGESDSALYTGNYLAAESFRFALAQDRLEPLYELRERRDRPAKGKGDGTGKHNGKQIPADLDEQIEAWEAQRDDAKAQVDVVAAQFHVLTNISESWRENPDLRLGGKSVDGSECQADWNGGSAAPDSGESDCDEPLPDELVHDLEQGEYQQDGWVDYGGGVITGGDTPVNGPQPGLLFRYCAPSDSDPVINPNHYTSRYQRLVENLPFDADKDGTVDEVFNCIGAPSRDAYAGVTFGLATALDFVGASDPALAEQIAGDIMVMTDYAYRYYWTQPRPHGSVVTPLWGNMLEASIQPDHMVQVPLHRLNMVQIAKHAAYVAGTAEQQARYEAMWAEEIATQLPVLAFSMEVDSAEAHNGYYKYHLHHMVGFNLIRLEQDPTVRAQFMQAFGVMDLQTRSHMNALYEAVSFALTGEEDRLDDAVLHHRQWLDYFARNQASGHVTRNSPRCGQPADDGGIACVAKHSRPVDFGPVGEDVEVDTGIYNDVPGMVQEAATGQQPPPPGQRAKDPLPVRDRYYADFMWQKDPTILDAGAYDPTYSVPGADFLLPYWMIRYYTEVAAPTAVTPFGTPDVPVIR